MFDVGFMELALIAVIGLIVLGPDRLPGAARTLGAYIGKAKRSLNVVKGEVQRELDAQDIRNEIMANNPKQSLDDFGKSLAEDILKDSKPREPKQ